MTTTQTGAETMSRAGRYTSLYTDLAKTIREGGLLRRRYAYYWTRIVAAIAAFSLIWGVVVILGDSWFQLICAAALGLVIAWNDWTSRLLAGAFAGLSYGWWKTKHNKHHAAPNQVERDPDIESGVLAFTVDIAQARNKGPMGWLVRHQGWLFFPLLTLEGLNLHVASFRTLLRPGSVQHQRIEALLVLGRMAAYIILLLWLMPLGKASAFFGLQMGIFGLTLGGAFAPNHKGMPIVPADMKVDFLRRQVLMSRNIRGGVLTDFAMGGLNYQIEHHLFPSMPRPNLPRAQPIVRAYCQEHGVDYTESGLFESYGTVVKYLNTVGLRGSDPFECPLVSLYRD
jgi:fatty acid desaturase